jgi:glycerol-3-phosphate dehydrogenase
MVAGLPAHPCTTKALKIHGWRNDVDPGTGMEAWENIYGSDAVKIQALVRETPALGKPLDANWSFTCAEVVWAVRREMARTVEDVLSRRFRVLFLDARAAMKMAPDVARIMKEELGKDEDWARQQVNAFQALASEYLLVAPDDVVTGADQP